MGGGGERFLGTGNSICEGFEGGPPTLPMGHKVRWRVVLNGIEELGNDCIIQDCIPCLGFCMKHMEDL